MFAWDESIAETAGWLIGIGMLLVFESLERMEKKLFKKDKVSIKELQDIKAENLMLKEENQRLKESQLHKKDSNTKEQEFNFFQQK